MREEFVSAFGDQVKLMKRQDEIQKELEECGEDMDRMGELLGTWRVHIHTSLTNEDKNKLTCTLLKKHSLCADELSEMSKQAVDIDVALIDKMIDQMMPELGFAPEDNDRLVASYSGGWQMRICLGKILLQQPDLLLLDEPTNHLDLDAIQWLEGNNLLQF